VANSLARDWMTDLRVDMPRLLLDPVGRAQGK
jgi:hypothetical protein